MAFTESRLSLNVKHTRARWLERFIESGLFLCAFLSVLTTLGIIGVLLTEAVYSFGSSPAFFQEVSPLEFFLGTRWEPQIQPRSFGVLPLLCGTFLIAGVAAVTGLPLGMLSAIYLSEYSGPQVRRVIKPVLEILAGIPTVVYGYFALLFITPLLLKPIFESGMGLSVPGFNALSAGLVVGIMIIPMVCSLSEDALRAVPRSLREAGYALGSNKFQVSTRIVVPAATSGIVASFLLAVSRAIGETMIVAVAAGADARLTLNPLHSVQTMTAFMVNISGGETPVGTIEYKSLYAVGLTLFALTLIMNILAQWIMGRFREVYQ